MNDQQITSDAWCRSPWRCSALRRIGGLFALCCGLVPGVRAGDGQVEPLTFEYFLDDVAGNPGDVVLVPFRVRTNRGLTMILASLEFDATALRFEEPPLLSRPLESLRNRLESEGNAEDFHFEWHADNESGSLQILVVVDYQGRERNSIPPGLFNLVAELPFRIADEADGSPVEIRFAAEGGFDSEYVDQNGQVFNRGKDHGAPFGPKDVFDGSEEPVETHDGTVLPIVGDVGFFLRGDANLDAQFDLSDSVRILNVLFQGGQDLPCFESADYTQDGSVDISDPIAILTNLFVGPTEGDDRGAAQREEPELVYCPLP